MGEGALSKAEMGAKIWRPPNAPRRSGAVAERSAESAGVKIFAPRLKISVQNQNQLPNPPDWSSPKTSGIDLSARRVHE